MNRVRLRPVVYGTNIRRHYGFYDGMLSGLLLWNGATFEFECTNPGSYSRHFLVYPLTGLRLAFQLRLDYLWHKYVGRNGDYSRKDGRRPIGQLKQREQWDGYYDSPRVQQLKSSLRSIPRPDAVAFFYSRDRALP